MTKREEIEEIQDVEKHLARAERGAVAIAEMIRDGWKDDETLVENEARAKEWDGIRQRIVEAQWHARRRREEAGDAANRE